MCLQPGCFQVGSCSGNSDLCSLVPRIPNAKCIAAEDTLGAAHSHHHKMVEGNRYFSSSLNSLIQILYSLYSLTLLTWKDLYYASVTNGAICPEGYIAFIAKHFAGYLWDRTGPVWKNWHGTLLIQTSVERHAVMLPKSRTLRENENYSCKSSQLLKNAQQWPSTFVKVCYDYTVINTPWFNQMLIFFFTFCYHLIWQLAITCWIRCHHS